MSRTSFSLQIGSESDSSKKKRITASMTKVDYNSNDVVSLKLRETSSASCVAFAETITSHESGSLRQTRGESDVEIGSRESEM